MDGQAVRLSVHRRTISWLTGIAALLLSTGCAMQPVVPVPEKIFQDELFKPPAQAPLTAEQVLAFTPAMRSFLNKEFAAERNPAGKRERLIDALYSRHMLKLEYDAAVTRTASEAFDARSGNCLSLVLMTAAFARELNLPVRFRNVLVDETWSRSSDLLFLSGHVNLTLGREPRPQTFNVAEGDGLTIDFVPPEMIRGQRGFELEEKTVVAMFMNNRAAESLNDGQLDEAYAWVRAALSQDSKLMIAYNTLGVIYRRHGNHEAAERAFRYVLGREPGNLQGLSNLALVYQDQGRTAEAAALRVQLAELQPYPPFRFFDRGLEAMKAGDYMAARDLFSKEVARQAYYHEFRFWLALANLGLGDVGQAKKQMALALENSTTKKNHELYAGKLEWLNSPQFQQNQYQAPGKRVIR